MNAAQRRISIASIVWLRKVVHLFACEETECALFQIRLQVPCPHPSPLPLPRAPPPPAPPLSRPLPPVVLPQGFGRSIVGFGALGCWCFPCKKGHLPKVGSSHCCSVSLLWLLLSKNTLQQFQQVPPTLKLGQSFVQGMPLMVPRWGDKANSWPCLTWMRYPIANKMLCKNSTIQMASSRSIPI